MQIDETAPINQVGHLIDESAKIVEIPLKNFTESLKREKEEINKDIEDIEIKDTLKFDSDEAEPEMPGFEDQKTEEIVQKEETKVEENGKPKDSTIEEEEDL